MAIKKDPGFSVGDVITLTNGEKSLVRAPNDPNIGIGDTILHPYGEYGHVAEIITAPNGCKCWICDDAYRDATPEEIEARHKRVQEVISRVAYKWAEAEVKRLDSEQKAELA